MYWRVALLILLTTSLPQAMAEPPDEQALRLLNHYRQLAGLTPVKLDRQLSAGCMEHANCMVQNQGSEAMAGLNPHTRRPNSPGASAVGTACAGFCLRPSCARLINHCVFGNAGTRASNTWRC
jgi:Cysteine-rich secretory protein family